MDDDAKRKGRGRGVGSVFRPTYRGTDGALKEAAIWWIRYSVRGQRFKESSKSTRRKDAVSLLRRRLEEVARHGMPAVDAERTTLKELIAGLEADYRRTGGARWAA